MRTVRVGTRGSPLALAQTDSVVAMLRSKKPDAVFEPVPIRTQGDEEPDRDLGVAIDLKRAFTKRIEDALLVGRVDLAVHSLKDLPVDLPEGLVIAAVPRRDTPWDALVTEDDTPLQELPPNARIGTSSLRRRAQLLAFRPSLRLADLSGNIGTRLHRLDAGEFDGVVLAEAGLRRLGLADRITQVLPPDLIVPAIGQGALAVEARADDTDMRALVGGIDDPLSHATTAAEREIGRLVGGGCNVPLGAVGVADGNTLRLEAVIASHDGRRIARASGTGPLRNPVAVAQHVAAELDAAGGREILRGHRG